MAKKVRRPPAQERVETAFEFPTFDEVAFIRKEFELTWGVAFAGLYAFVTGLLSWLLSIAGIPWYGPVVVSLGLIATAPTVFERLNVRSESFTKGDWAGLFVVMLFGWLALWFLFTNLSPHGI